MAISPELIPYRVVKSLSTRLTRHSNPPSKLSSTQEALAKAMGYENWSDLSVAYDTFQNSSQLQVFGSYIDRTLDAGSRRLIMEVVKGHGTRFYMETRSGETIILDEVDDKLGDQIARIFYNVLMDPEDKFTTFDPSRPDSGYALVGISRGQYHIATELVPTQAGFVARFDLYAVGAGVYLPDFFNEDAIETLQKVSRLTGVVFVQSNDSAARTTLIQALASLTTSFRPTTVVSPTPLPMLRPSKSLRCIVQKSTDPIRENSLLSLGAHPPAYILNSSNQLYDLRHVRFPKSSLLVVGVDENTSGREGLLQVMRDWPTAMIVPSPNGSIHTLSTSQGVGNEHRSD